MATTMTRVVPRGFSALQRKLSAKREELLARFSEQRAEVLVEHEPDDEGAEANRNANRDLAFSILDRERRTIQEIEAAQQGLKAGDYGVCDECGTQISNARLRALPWTRLCIHCAERAAMAYRSFELRY